MTRPDKRAAHFGVAYQRRFDLAQDEYYRLIQEIGIVNLEAMMVRLNEVIKLLPQLLRERYASEQAWTKKPDDT